MRAALRCRPSTGVLIVEVKQDHRENEKQTENNDASRSHFDAGSIVLPKVSREQSLFLLGEHPLLGLLLVLSLRHGITSD